MAQLICNVVWIVLLVFKFREIRDFFSWKEYLEYKGLRGIKAVLYTYFFWPCALIKRIIRK